MPVAVDLFSCAGLYADGLAQGLGPEWELVCVDNDPAALKHNPHPTVLGDVMDLLVDPGFTRDVALWLASPPCQGYSATRCLANAQGRGQGRAVDLLGPVEALLNRTERPWVIENVERSPLRGRGAVRLCGSAFGLQVQRHRLFLASPGLVIPPVPCDHGAFPPDPDTGRPRPWGVYYSMGDRIPSGGRTVDTLAQGHQVMGVTDRTVPWRYLCEGLPPAYGRHVGAAVRAALVSSNH